MRIVRVCFYILFIQASSTAFSQPLISSTLNATGGSSSNDALLLDWSVGEMTMVHSVFTPGVIVTAGVIQPPVTLFNRPLDFPSGLIRVFPTITSNLVQLISQLPGPGNFNISVTDVLGRTMFKSGSNINGGNTQQAISLAMLSRGVYFLQIRYRNTSGENYQSVFKILKL